jgi:hypothetical protein
MAEYAHRKDFKLTSMGIHHIISTNKNKVVYVGPLQEPKKDPGGVLFLGVGPITPTETKYLLSNILGS